jgi:hypothetical protein
MSEYRQDFEVDMRPFKIKCRTCGEPFMTTYILGVPINGCITQCPACNKKWNEENQRRLEEERTRSTIAAILIPMICITILIILGILSK